MENKLIKINSMETLENGFISVNADFELGHLSIKIPCLSSLIKFIPIFYKCQQLRFIIFGK